MDAGTEGRTIAYRTIATWGQLSQPIDCATKQTKKWLTDGAHRGGTEDKRIDLPRLEGREGQGLLSCLQWKGRERTED